MVDLDRSFFHKTVPLLVAYFPDARFLGQFVKACKQDVLYLPSIKHIVPVDDSKGVLLRQDIDDIHTYQDKLSPVAKELIEKFNVEVRPYAMELNYDFWKLDDILGAVLPENLLSEIPTGFAQAGHIAHINLRDEFKPYGALIGQVILDKNPKIETVVDKLQSIDTKFRTFQMKVLAGKDDLNVEQSESGCKFRFDFSKVYWNSRLSLSMKD
jgi:tRNA (guanine37-N1)-methyltransferase